MVPVYFFNDIINIKVFDLNLLKIDKMSYENIDIYYFGYIRAKDHVNVHSVSPLYLKKIDLIFVIISIFYAKVLSMNHIFAMVVIS